MSLQTSGAGFSALRYHGIAPGSDYRYVPVTTKLDPITEQIIKKDSALEAIKLIESGAASQLWEAQKAQPSVTWVGNLIDRIFGWGNYYLEIQKTAKVVSEEEQKRSLSTEMCPNDNYVIHDYLYTGYETKTYPNHSCIQLDRVNYYTEIFQIILKPVGYDDVICRIAGCMRDRLLTCYPTCLPCRNASEIEKNNTLTRLSDVMIFDSDFDEKLIWVYVIQSNYQSNFTNLNKWKMKEIHTLFNTTRKECENQVLHPKENKGLYALLIIPIAVCGSVIFYIYKRIREKEEYAPLKQLADNL